MKLKFVLFLSMCLSATLSAFSQEENTTLVADSASVPTTVLIVPADTLMVRYLDSLTIAVQKYQGGTTSTKQNPYLYKMTINPTYYNAPFRQALGLDSVASPQQQAMYQALLQNYLQNPSYYTTTEDRLNEVRQAAPTKVTESAPVVQVEELVTVDAPTMQAETIELQAERPNFWTHNANIYFQFSQSKITENWYNGGESNNTMLGGFTLEAKYDDQKRIEWENKAEIKVGFITSKGDTLHHYKTNNDLFRLSTKFGYKAIKNLYWTALGELNNQFFPGYKTNDPVKYSNILAPLKFNASLGIDYKRKKDKKYELSVALLPASYNFIWVAGHEVDPVQFGIREGKRTLHTLGSKVQVDHTLYFTTNIFWKSHFYVFTSYDNTDALWENTLDFAMNKYLSAKMYLNFRFDDSAVRSNKNGYLQLQELLSFGISYNL